MLNISNAQYNCWTANGGFFQKVNGPWIDAAVIQNANIIVVSYVYAIQNIYSTKVVNGLAKTELTGFGKEIHRLEWKHGYRFDSSKKMMVPPNKSGSLQSITQQSDYIHN